MSLVPRVHSVHQSNRYEFTQPPLPWGIMGKLTTLCSLLTRWVYSRDCGPRAVTHTTESCRCTQVRCATCIRGLMLHTHTHTHNQVKTSSHMGRCLCSTIWVTENSYACFLSTEWWHAASCWRLDMSGWSHHDITRWVRGKIKHHVGFLLLLFLYLEAALFRSVLSSNVSQLT